MIKQKTGHLKYKPNFDFGHWLPQILTGKTLIVYLTHGR